jgi:hypothetical protein
MKQTKDMSLEQIIGKVMVEGIRFFKAMEDELAKELKEKESASQPKEAKAQGNENQSKQELKDINQLFVQNDVDIVKQLAFRIATDFLKQFPQANGEDKHKFISAWLNQVFLGMLQSGKWQSGHDLKTIVFNSRLHFNVADIESFVEFVQASFVDNEPVFSYQTASSDSVQPTVEPKPVAEPKSAIEPKAIAEPTTTQGNTLLSSISDTLQLNGYKTADVSDTHVSVKRDGHLIASLNLYRSNVLVQDARLVLADELANEVHVSKLLKGQMVKAIQSNRSNQEIQTLANQLYTSIVNEEVATDKYNSHKKRLDELVNLLTCIMITTQGVH